MSPVFLTVSTSEIFQGKQANRACMHVSASGLEGPRKRAAVSTACLLGILLFIPFLFVSYPGTGGNGEHLQERWGHPILTIPLYRPFLPSMETWELKQTNKQTKIPLWEDLCSISYSSDDTLSIPDPSLLPSHRETGPINIYVPITCSCDMQAIMAAKFLDDH